MYSKNDFIIELSGLPGCGKSTVCKEINKTLLGKRLFLLNIYKNSRFKFLISIPLIPFVLIKFYKIFILLCFSKLNGFNKLNIVRIKGSIIAVLSMSLMEYSIAKTSAKLRGKLIILDGGFVQWGLAVYVRTPPEIRDLIWKAYLSHLPKKLLCFILDCEVEEALKRAYNRRDGVPSVFLSRPWASKNVDYLKNQYSDLSELISGLKLKSGISFVYISSLNDVTKQRDIILKHLKKMSLKNLIIG